MNTHVILLDCDTFGMGHAKELFGKKIDVLSTQSVEEAILAFLNINEDHEKYFDYEDSIEIATMEEISSSINVGADNFRDQLAAPVELNMIQDLGKKYTHGSYDVELVPGGDIKISYKGEQIVWVDNHYLNNPDINGDDYKKGKPHVVVNATQQDEPSVTMSIGDHWVIINNIDKNITEQADA